MSSNHQHLFDQIEKSSQLLKADSEADSNSAALKNSSNYNNVHSKTINTKPINEVNVDPDHFYSKAPTIFETQPAENEPDVSSSISSTHNQALESLQSTKNLDAGLDILVDLAKSGEIDPWDVDLEVITAKFLNRIYESSIVSLKEAGKVIFYASTLLRIKSDMLSLKAAAALEVGQEDDYSLEDELAEYDLKEISIREIESALVKRQIRKKPRFRKLRLDDLIMALQEASEEDERKKKRLAERISLQGFSDIDDFIEPEIESDDLLELTHAENIEDAIEHSRYFLSEHLINGAGIRFEKLVQFLKSRSNAFLAVLFLAHESFILLRQEEFYGELWLYQAEA
jgi:segregation and condensation protein A